MTPPSLSSLLHTVRQSLYEGGRVVKKGFSRIERISYKSPVSLLTNVDVAAEKKIISLIRKRYPDHSFLAEESTPFAKRKESRPQRGYRWVIDPLDGTTNFVHGIPQVGVSIAVEKDNIVLAGGVFDPFRNELFLSARGKGTHLNDKQVHVSPEKRMERALLITGFPYDRTNKAQLHSKILTPFLKRSIGVRRFGAASLDLAWVACGRAEAFWEFQLSPWDVAAGSLLVEEAGGRMSNFSNQPYQVSHPTQTLATNGRIHQKMIKVFQRLRKTVKF